MIESGQARRPRIPRTVVAVLGIVIGIALGVVGARFWQAGHARAGLPGESAFHAVLLTNGQLFFGRVDEVKEDVLLMRDVSYLQTQVNNDTKDVRVSLVRRANDIHGPDRTAINRRLVLFVEPVGPDSQVGKLLLQPPAAK